MDDMYLWGVVIRPFLISSRTPPPFLPSALTFWIKLNPKDLSSAGMMVSSTLSQVSVKATNAGEVWMMYCTIKSIFADKDRALISVRMLGWVSQVLRSLFLFSVCK